MNSLIIIKNSISRYYVAKSVTLIAIVAIVIYMYATLYVPGGNDNKPILFDILSHKHVEANVETVSRDDDNEEQLYEERNEDVKYILQWHKKGSSPFYLIGKDNSVFFKYNCPYTSCIMTDDPNYLSDVTRFDAVLFHGNEIDHEILKLPPKRSTKQKYVFAATESAHYYPIQNPIYDNFFNWTWTYRLDSEVYWGYITVYDLNGTVVGPKLEMHWPDMDPIGIEIKNNLVNKSKAAAWFVSNCNSKSHRELEVTKIQIELAKYGWSVDIYGKCGELKCPRSNSKSCYELIKKDYYFYFSFENSFAEDYVTEKLLTALNNYAVPVVFGAANYSSRKNIEANAKTTSKDEDRQELYEKSNVDVKYILQWHEDGSYPFYLIGEDNSVFFKYNCPYTNCIMTDDPNYLSDVTRFDAVLFHGNEIDHEILKLPPKRSTKQKYVFAATESAHYYPIQNPIYDNFFNWTWTYRLDSEVYWGYITIYDLNGIVVGPKLEMHWPDMDPIGIEIQNNLVNKSKAAAWFVSNCNSKSHRELEVTKIQIELAKYGWSVDIYGKCGELKCPRSNSKSCYELIKKDYYFYFSFENSFAEDYVTEKLLTALNNYAVPVVFGAANYSRFVPPGAYLNARELGPEKLAKAMDEIIKNKTRYYDFFRWRNHFVYEETIGTIDGCNICTALNDQEKFNTYSLYENFRKWWNEYD